MSPADRDGLAPAFLLWGYPERRDNTLSMLGRGRDLFEQTSQTLGTEHYAVVSLVYGAPYGATRVYARVTGARATRTSTPLVAAYDATRNQWLRRELPPLAVTFTPAERLTVRLGYSEPLSGRTAARTIRADVPAGIYLIRITGAAGTGTLAATSKGEAEQTVGELGPDGDFAPYRNDAAVYLLHAHSGGSLAVSQFADDSAPGFGAVEVIPIGAAVADSEKPADHQFHSVAPSSWVTPMNTSVSTTTEGGTLVVRGDATQFGYQVLGPRTSGTAGSRVGARVSLTQTSGYACVGALNGTEQRWLVAPTLAQPEYWFDIDGTGAFRMVVTNCNVAARGNVASAFRVESASIAIDGPELYVDRLMRAAGFGVTR